MPETLDFVDLFAGLGGFHRALGDGLGHNCVFASEIVPGLQDLYKKNFDGSASYLKGDIVKAVDDVPKHDILAGGFPCPSFSKSGKQHGRRENRGKLMRQIVKIASARKPSYVLLENVGNFGRIGKGAAWRELKIGLETAGYHVSATEHKASGGNGLISPHHLGFPHQRERFYIVATREDVTVEFPARQAPKTSLSKVVEEAPSAAHKRETVLSDQQVRCINHWNNLIKAVPEKTPILSPLWGDEAWETYPFRSHAPWGLSADKIRDHVGAQKFPPTTSKEAYIEGLPSYARTPVAEFPSWKVAMIGDSRDWFGENLAHAPGGWLETLKKFPASLRKLEWNCMNEERDLWTKVLQFRPSGLRAKRYNASPALVAMTSTQVPILGPEKRYLTRIEGLRLQGFPDEHQLPGARAEAFAALGNAVHVGVVKRIAKAALAAS